MKKIPLTPYPGEMLLTRCPKEFARAYRRLTGEAYRHEVSTGGVSVKMISTTHEDVELVYVEPKRNDYLAHEIGHVLLRLFKSIGSDPADGSGEPFCYMLSELMRRAGKK